ncbi:MAG TPA: transaldolase family protein [Candidatus Saccharimonadales bacterium]|nr:transaldolase family protein [Candidatus Saccharimonadales bacterium]
MTKFLLDSGDPIEYREISQLAKEKGSELWGATTNPSLIAKKLAGKKVTQEEALQLQKDLVMEILEIVPGAVSAEVYAEETTPAEQMIQQGKDIATWNERIYVKLPTTLEGFKARTALRKENIAVNNTLVFSQEQIYAICLHDLLVHKEYNTSNTLWPPFISPFLGRLDDIGKDGLTMLEHGMELKNTFFNKDIAWMLSASIRSTYHIKKTMDANCEIMTAPAKIYKEWFTLSEDEKNNLSQPATNLTAIPLWQPPEIIKNIQTIEDFMNAIETNALNINHPLTQQGIEKFTADWKTLINS